jgi:hypothetical protein
MSKSTKSARLSILLLTLVSFGCSKEVAYRTSSGDSIVMSQHNVSLYRDKPHIWPAKGKVIATDDELLFIPTPYFGIFNLNGRDTTVIKTNTIELVQPGNWSLIFPFELEVMTNDGKSYSFVTVRRGELSRKIEQLRE